MVATFVDAEAELGRHWSEVTPAAVGQDDPLALGIERLRPAGPPTLGLPPDRAHALAPAKQELAGAAHAVGQPAFRRRRGAPGARRGLRGRLVTAGQASGATPCERWSGRTRWRRQRAKAVEVTEPQRVGVTRALGELPAISFTTDPKPAPPTLVGSSSSVTVGDTVALSGANWNAGAQFGSSTSPDSVGENELRVEICGLGGDAAACSATTGVGQVPLTRFPYERGMMPLCAPTAVLPRPFSMTSSRRSRSSWKRSTRSRSPP